MARYRTPDSESSSIDFIPENHRAIKISNIINKLNLDKFDATYKNDRRGRAAYPIRNLIKLLTYSYLEGVYSSRRIERYCKENIVYKFLCCDDPPDHTTISKFWKRFFDPLKSLFKQVVKLAENQGLLAFKHISGDGVRIGSMGSRAMLFNLKNANRKMDSINKRENEGRKFNETVKNKLIKALPKLEYVQNNRGKSKEHTTFVHLTEPDARLIKKRDHFISGYNAQAAVDNGSGIIVAADVVSSACDRHMGTPLLKKLILNLGHRKLLKSHISFDNGYENEEFFGFAEKMNLKLFVPTQDPDKSNLKTRKPKSTQYPLKFSRKFNAYICHNNHLIPYRRKSIVSGRAYAIYEKTCTHCHLADKCIGAEVKRKRKRVNRPLPGENLSEEIKETRLEAMKYRIEMFKRMSSDTAREIYSKRVATVEPAFAQIEANRSFRRFSVWGLKKVQAQWLMVCISHNLLKIISY